MTRAHSVKRTRGFLLAACLSGGLIAAASAAVPALPQATIIPVTDTLPLGSARYPGANFVDLDSHGYVEEEYTLSGKANVRDEAGTVIAPAQPYTTRILIRRPRDAAKFSGNVVVTPFNWAQETAREWAFTKSYLLDHGDVFVGVSNVKDVIPGFPGQHGIKLLHEFDPVRYGAINVYDDHNARRNDMAQGQDLLAQLALLIRTRAATGPFRGLAVKHVIAFAEGVQADVFQHYVGQGRHKEYRRPDGKPLYDAFLLGAYHLLPEPAPATRDDVAYVIIQHQREIHRDAKDKVADPADTDAPEFRLYDFVGSAHMGAVPIRGYNDLTVNLDAPELTARAGGAPGRPGAGAGPGAPPPPPPPGPPGGLRAPRPAVCASGNPEPSGLVFIALLDDLKHWVATARPMPHAVRAERTDAGEKIDAATGNAEGGVRPPWITVPAATYLTGDTVGCGGTEPMVMYTPDRLVGLYGSYAAYRQKFAAAKARFIAQGFLLPENAADLRPTAKPENFVTQ